jgi:cyanuric acid amidohydrolase
MSVHVVRYETAHPGDTSDLSEQLAAFPANRMRKVALLAKTEGNSDVNDFSRQYGMLSARLALLAHGGEKLVERSSFLFSTGCEGAMTPFGYLFVDLDDEGAPAASGEALVFGRARSRSLRSEEIGTPQHSDIVAETVKAAMTDAGVGQDEVGLAIVKTPVTSHIPAIAKKKAGNKRITSAFSKAVGALGAGVALGEVDRAMVVQEAFDRDHTLHARRAIVFSGSELDCVEILLLANKRGAAGNLRVHAGHLVDLLDAEGIRRVLAEAGCRIESCAVADPDRVVAILLKVGLDPSGALRGSRTTMRTSHLDTDKHLRATMSGIIGSIVGTTHAFISANTVHQTAPGGGICAFIVRQG